MDDGAYGLTGSEREPNIRHLFEDCAWLYAFCREHLFRDHTEEIATALFPKGVSSTDVSVLEVGCGPGFYARRLAQRFPSLRVLGIDRSARLLELARARVSSDDLGNCRFQEGDVERLSTTVDAVDAVVSSRLLLVVADRRTAISEIFQVLKPGGRLFLVEPTANLKTQLPLSAMRLVARFSHSSHRETAPKNATILSPQEFEDLVRCQPWANVTIQMFGDYQCAVCEKGFAQPNDLTNLETQQESIAAAGSRSVA